MDKIATLARAHRAWTKAGNKREFAWIVYKTAEVEASKTIPFCSPHVAGDAARRLEAARAAFGKADAARVSL